MILFRQKRQLIALWSCVLVLFSALAPAISQTLAAQGNPMMVACAMLNQISRSDTGSKYMPLSPKTAAASPDSSAPVDTLVHPGTHQHHQPAPDPALLASLDAKTENDIKSNTKSDTEHEHQNPAHGMVHCPYCNLMHHSPAFLAGNAPQLLSGNLSYEMPALYYHAPRPLFVWAATQPRGPPTLS